MAAQEIAYASLRLPYVGVVWVESGICERLAVDGVHVVHDRCEHVQVPGGQRLSAPVRV